MRLAIRMHELYDEFTVRLIDGADKIISAGDEQGEAWKQMHGLWAELGQAIFALGLSPNQLRLYAAACLFDADVYDTKHNDSGEVTGVKHT